MIHVRKFELVFVVGNGLCHAIFEWFNYKYNKGTKGTKLLQL